MLVAGAHAELVTKAGFEAPDNLSIIPPGLSDGPGKPLREVFLNPDLTFDNPGAIVPP